MQRHNGRVVLVTGAASGIGRATALRFAGEGAAVALCDINERGGAEVSDEIRAGGGRAAFFAADVTDEDAVRQLIAAVVDEFGRIDYAHNNAGGRIGRTAGTADQPYETWLATIALNLNAAFLLIKYELRTMLPQ